MPADTLNLISPRPSAARTPITCSLGTVPSQFSPVVLVRVRAPAEPSWFVHDRLTRVPTGKPSSGTVTSMSASGRPVASVVAGLGKIVIVPIVCVGTSDPGSSSATAVVKETGGIARPPDVQLTVTVICLIPPAASAAPLAASMRSTTVPIVKSLPSGVGWVLVPAWASSWS